MFKGAIRYIVFVIGCMLAPYGVVAETLDSETTQIVMLGTGTPNPFPDRSGPSVAIVVNDEPYLIDFGPGVVRQASAMSPEYGGSVKGLAVENIKHAFLTHLHSDHTVGLPDLILTAWTVGRDEPLKLFGPEGTKHMADKVLEAYEEDIRYRLYSEQPANNEAQVLNLLRELQEKRNLTYLFISHDLSVVKFMSDDVIVMQNGKIVERGKAQEIYDQPKSDYTKELLDAVPKVSTLK